MTTTTKRPSDAEIVKLLRDAASDAIWHCSGKCDDPECPPSQTYYKLREAADALEAAPALTFEERLDKATQALATMRDKGTLDDRASNYIALMVLRAAYPENAL